MGTGFADAKFVVTRLVQGSLMWILSIVCIAGAVGGGTLGSWISQGHPGSVEFICVPLGALLGLILGSCPVVLVFRWSDRTRMNFETIEYIDWLRTTDALARRTGTPVAGDEKPLFVLWACLEGFLLPVQAPPWGAPMAAFIFLKPGVHHQWLEWVEQNSFTPRRVPLPKEIPSPFENGVIRAIDAQIRAHETHLAHMMHHK